MTFFDAPNPQEEALAEAMQRQWEDDIAEVKRRRIIPDWVGEPRPLSKDRAAFLNLILSNGSALWTNNPSRNNLEVARAMGYRDRPKDGTADFNLFGVDDDVNIVANAKATIDAMVKAGLIKGVSTKTGVEYEMTIDGEYALDDWQIEKELGFV